MEPMVEGAMLAERYRLYERLGQGGMAAVYRAHDTRLDRAVAVKILTAHDRHAAVLAAREAQLAARLTHPHIVEVYDRGTTSDERPFLVLRLVDGPSVAGAAPVPLARALTIGAEIAAALAHAHAHGIIHGDVTPQNILLDPARGAQLTDFGVASTATASSDTFIYGAAAYVAPERLRGAPLTPATDIYALGATLYQLLVGLPPYAGISGEEIATQVLSGPPVPLRVLLPTLPPAVDAIIGQAMARDPADRYPSAEALQAALVAGQRGEPGPVRAARALVANLAAAGHAFLRAAKRHLPPPPLPASARRSFRDEVGALRDRLLHAIVRAPRRASLIGLALLLLLIAPLVATIAPWLHDRFAPVAAQDVVAPTGTAVDPATRPPPTVPARVAPRAPIQVEATISDPQPPRTARITVTGRLWRGDTGIAGVPLRSIWHFRSGDTTCRGAPTGPDGRASCTFSMGGATAGYPVTVEVFFDYEGQTYQAQVTFTPR